MSAYTDGPDLAVIERAAWQRGDYATAQLAEAAMVNAEAAEECERLRDMIEGIKSRIAEANWRTGKKTELRDLIEQILLDMEAG